MNHSSQDEFVLESGVTVRKALEVLEKNSTKVVFICSSTNGQVIGSVTDGDIRRAMLRGESLDSPVERVSNKAFISAYEDSTQEEILALIREHGVRQIPILDCKGRLISVRTLEQFVTPANFSLPAVIMAGGKGTRLYPLTKDTPKPLLKIGDLSIIERLVLNLKSQGINRFHISVNHLAEQIVNKLGDGSKMDCEIQYVRELMPLGTAGSLSLLRLFFNEDFLVINGDILSTVDLRLLKEFHEAHRPMVTVCSKIYDVSIPYGVMQLAGADLKGIEEKPKVSYLINSGIYLFSKGIFDHLPENEYLDMPDLIQRLIRKGLSVKCFQSYEPWLDVGSREDFRKAQEHVAYLT